VEITSPQGSVVTADSGDSFAKTVFALLRRIPFRAGLALLAELVFDSFQDLAPVGIRGAAAAPQQLVYEAGGYLIDLQLEQQTGGAGALTGQVVMPRRNGRLAALGLSCYATIPWLDRPSPIRLANFSSTVRTGTT
jgi:hypothetical protein